MSDRQNVEHIVFHRFNPFSSSNKSVYVCVKMETPKKLVDFWCALSPLSTRVSSLCIRAIPFQDLLITGSVVSLHHDVMGAWGEGGEGEGAQISPK